MTKRSVWVALIVALASRLSGLVGEAEQPPRATAPAAPLDSPVEYNRDIRPILSNNCFKCHGLDERARKAGLRLDIRELATRPSELGGTAIVPGKPDESELVKRVFSADEGFMMPPPASTKRISAAEKELLKKWIEQGAEYQPHWSFISPKRPALPQIKNAGWPRNSIDHFILARLDAEGLRPSQAADKTTLIRRVTLDLTGLPPTPAEVDAFLADTSADPYEKLVDRLLDSPRYGERMAVDWLDAARFADTHGYHIDSGRDMSRWREWVIDSFNHNLPFDRFTIEQLAGDLLPGATVEQKIASGFNRNHMINFEGGAIPEEYHNAYIVDRVNTTGTVWLGLTIGCAQCHEHKYDPITQKEYYQLYAFFHNVPENGLDGRAGNAAPLLKIPTGEQQQSLDRLAASIKEIETRVSGPLPETDAAQAEWEKSAAAAPKTEWTVLEPIDFKSRGGAKLTKLDDKSILASGDNPATETYTLAVETEMKDITAIRLEALPDDSFAARGPGRSVNGNIVLTDVRVAASVAGRDASPVKLKAASADFSQNDFPVANAIDDKPDTGWAIHPEVGKPHAAVFEAEHPIVVAGTDSSSNAKAKTRLVVTLDFQSKFSQHQCGRFRLSVTTSTDPHESKKTPDKLHEILVIAPEKRTDPQRAELRTFYRTTFSAEFKQLNEQLGNLRKEQTEIEKRIATTMVMQEMDKPRDTFMLIRGQYDKKGEQVTPAVPASFGRLPETAPANRLGLARWLVDTSQPLTARVIVNRYWQMYFGTGLVKTAEDFGSQGEWPSHPELLDWLATEFMKPSSTVQQFNGSTVEHWDIKHIQRLIVTSATYRQSSAVTPALFAKDPENRLLARGPRLRLQVEFIRDQALAISGLLNGEIGGHSVSPYQPTGIWEELASRQDGKNWTAQEYVQSHGKDLYRRTMYTFIKRTAPPPSLVTFDAPDRETCTVRRSRTNTPLQALIMMNDPTYVEASRKLAERLMKEAATDDDRIRFGFRLATARPPSPDELSLIRRLFDRQLAAYRANPQAALKLLTVGESPRDDKVDAAELAAWTMVASVILNLDETVTKG